MSEIKGYTKVEFRFKPRDWGDCYHVGNTRGALIIPKSVTKSVEEFYGDGIRCSMYIKDWFFEKYESDIKLKGKR